MLTMRHKCLLLALFTVVLAAGVALAAAALRGRGLLVGRVTPTDLGGGHVDLAIAGKGHISHLGRSTFSLHLVADFSGPEPAPVPPTEGLITAANGDRVSFTVSGWTAVEVAPNSFRVEGPFQITGGTGRFQSATGSGFYRGGVDLNTRVAAAKIEGTLVRKKK
jgi:hypothetical protein